MPRGRPAASAPPERRRDRNIEEIKYTQTHRKDGKGLLKQPKDVSVFRPHVGQPKIQGRDLKRIEGKRHEGRPSAVAKKSGKRRITETEWADEYEMFSDWEEESEDMPDEDEREDTGCLCVWVPIRVSFVSNWLQRSRLRSVHSLASSRSLARGPEHRIRTSYSGNSNG